MHRPALPLPTRLIALAALLALPARIVETRPLDPGRPQADSTPASTFAFLPAVGQQSPRSPSLGIENEIGKTRDPLVLARAQQLSAGWLRLSAVAWKAVEPDPPAGGVHTYRWEALSTLERDILAANQIGLTVLLSIKEHPTWAVVEPAKPCSAVRDDRLLDYAAFVRALVERYRAPPFSVKHWELGNEPDVDPSLVAADAGYGCWGDIADPYYGGARYGRMLNAVGPVIRAADPTARIVFGGLLLLRPATPSSDRRGAPEKFLEGALRVPGAADNFDILACHAYTWYQFSYADSDLNDPYWQTWGGTIAGKTRYVRQVLERYGAAKPIAITELSFLCSSPTRCHPPSAQYFEVQADHVARLLSRARFHSVELAVWYTLNGPGWAYTSLLDANQDPRPAYLAFRTFSAQVGAGSAPTLTNAYGSAVEAYRFLMAGRVTDVLWSRTTTARTVSIPLDQFIAAYDRDGRVITPTVTSGQTRLQVGFSPIYITRRTP